MRRGLTQKKTVTFQSIWQEASLEGLVRESSFIGKGHDKSMREMTGPKMFEFRGIFNLKSKQQVSLSSYVLNSSIDQT